MLPRTQLSLALILAIPLIASAQVFGNSNLPVFGYPDHDCRKPMKPRRPYSLDSQWEVDRYNAEVDRFNADLERFVGCIREYVEGADNDIRQIRQKAQAAIDNLDSPY